MAIPRNSPRHHVVHDEVSENRYTDFERDGEGYIIEYSESRGHDGQLAIKEGIARRLGFRFGYLHLSFLEAEKR
jgi:hypothetical protein